MAQCVVHLPFCLSSRYRGLFRQKQVSVLGKPYSVNFSILSKSNVCTNSKDTEHFTSADPISVLYTYVFFEGKAVAYARFSWDVVGLLPIFLL
jgi:hypothetical protein